MQQYPMPPITSEDDILREEVRKAMIDHWLSPKNQDRKREAFRAYECLKDKTNNYVMDLLLKQFEIQTVVEMQYAITNISILRKVIDKLAKVYANGAKRTMPKEEKKPAKKPGILSKIGAALGMGEKPAPTDKKAPPAAEGAPPVEGEQPAPELGPDGKPLPGADPAAQEVELEAEDPETKALDDFVKYLKLDESMRKCNRYFRTFRNTLAFPKPVNNGEDKYDIQIEILPPFHYDAVENPHDPTKALAIVLSDYQASRKSMYYLGDTAVAGRGSNTGHVVDAPVNQALPGTGIIKGEEPEDKREWVWWSKNYHFTTDSKGRIKDGGVTDLETAGKNPILELPFVNFAGEQDNCFWAEGGSDLVDGGIQINVDLSNYRNIGTVQGYGQLYMIGKGLPKSVKVGPQHCVQLEQQSAEDPRPEVGFLNANAPMGDMKSGLEMFVALYLTTNNLSVSAVASSLNGGKDFASGIAMMIDKSESIEDINDQAKIFIEKEPKVLDIAAKWHAAYKADLTEEARLLKPPKDIGKEQVSFPPSEPLVSENERLDALKKRKDLGLNTMIELIQRDNPGMTVSEAADKLERIKAEKTANAAAFGTPQMNGAGDPNAQGDVNGNQGQEGNGVGVPNGNKPGFGVGQAQAPGGNQVPN